VSQHVAPAWFPADRPPAWEPDTLFLLDPRDEATVLAAGGRLADEYREYFAPTTAKATLVPGPFSRLGVGQPGGLIFPVDGLLPVDQFTVSFWLHPTGATSADLLTFGRHLVVRLQDGEVVAQWLPAELDARVPLTTGEGWQPYSVTWDGRVLTVLAGNGDRTATAKLDTAPDTRPEARPCSGADGGLRIGGHGVEIAEVHVSRFARTPGAVVVFNGPTVSVDAGATDGGRPFPRNVTGVLALYTGFRMHEDGKDPDVGTAIRDAQFRACAAAGMPLARFGGVVSATRIDEDGTYDFSVVDEKLRLLHELGVAFHFTLDYNHPTLGGNPADPPADPERYAEIASTVFAHLRQHYRVASVTLWNEPDIEDYWTGTREQFFDLWRVMQRRFLADHPDMLLATGDFAHAENTVAHLRDIAAHGLPVAAACMHTYAQDLDKVAADIQSIRTTADALGFPGLPIRLPEWGMDILLNQERYSNSRSVANAWPNRFRTDLSAAYAIAFVHDVLAADAGVDLATFSSIGSVDHGYLPPGAYTIADEALFSSDDPPRPFPSFAALSMLWRLRGQRVAATSNWPGVRVLATTGATTGATTVVYGSYRPWQPGDRFRLTLDWRGLPGRFTWKRWDLHGVVGSGDQDDLPIDVELAAVDAGAIEVTEPR